GTNTAATLVSQQQGSATGDLFQAESGAGTNLLSVDYSGSLTVGNEASTTSSSRLFSDGFESGTFSEWTGSFYGTNASVTTSTPPARNGLYSAHFTNAAGAGSGSTDNITPSTTVAYREYVYVTSATGSVNLMGISDSTDTNEITTFRDASGNLALWNSASGV